MGLRDNASHLQAVYKSFGCDAGFMFRPNIDDRLNRQSRFGLRPSQL